MKKNISMAVLLLIASLCIPFNIYADSDVPKVTIEENGYVIINSNEEVLFETEAPNIMDSREINLSDVLLGDESISEQETIQSEQIDSNLVENEVDDIVDGGVVKNITFGDKNSDNQWIKEGDGQELIEPTNQVNTIKTEPIEIIVKTETSSEKENSDYLMITLIS